MYNYLLAQQSDIMMAFIGISILLLVFLFATKPTYTESKPCLIAIGMSVSAILMFDRAVYLCEGQTGTYSYLIVRIGSFFRYFLILFTINSIGLYIQHILRGENDDKSVMMIIASRHTAYVGMLLVIISQFTGLYYYFDEYNVYHRGSGFMLCLLAPSVSVSLLVFDIIKHEKSFSSFIKSALLSFLIFPVVAAVFQYYYSGLFLVDIAMMFFVIVLYYSIYRDINQKAEKLDNIEIKYLEKEQKRAKQLFEQTAEALANAIDAKDKYTRGHSSRVAEYSKEIARLSGKSAKECEEVYYAALLHDVGKIGIPDTIINKTGKLTDEEYDIIKQHPVIGNEILMGISSFPYLSIGAHYHHERYDGKGYPEGLIGNDIPEIARIIAVADAYDAMTSKRTYRPTVPQETVMEEIVKNSGTQFDPKFAKIMKTMIDHDIHYKMKEKEELDEFAGRSDMYCIDYRDNKSMGIILDSHIVNIEMCSEPLKKSGIPSLIIFDSLDGRVHDEDNSIKKEMMYIEYGVIRLDGHTELGESRKYKKKLEPSRTNKKDYYKIRAVKYKDHIMFSIDNGTSLNKIIIALPDSTRFTYFSVTGEYCHITNTTINRENNEIGDDFIPRIAEYVSFIDGPAGDVPNIQIDGWRAAISEGMLIKHPTTLTFHSKSLYTARLIWHCPYISIYTSDDGKFNGLNCREYGLIRLDGEQWTSEYADIDVRTEKRHDFVGWDDWKKKNKEGLDYSVDITVKDNVVIVESENLGVHVKAYITMKDEPDEIYAAVTGDQCVVTNIRIFYKDKKQGY